MDDDARPQPRSNTRMPGRRSSAVVSHSVNQSALAPPLALARTHSGWYCEERGKRSETSRVSAVMWILLELNLLAAGKNQSTVIGVLCVDELPRLDVQYQIPRCDPAQPLPNH